MGRGSESRTPSPNYAYAHLLSLINDILDLYKNGLWVTRVDVNIPIE